MFNKRLFLTKRRRRSNRFLNLKTLLQSLNPVSGLSTSRRLSSSADKLMRVRLGSDNSELDIGFKNNVLDTQALIEFGGYNLLGYTEDLTNNLWVKNKVSVSFNSLENAHSLELSGATPNAHLSQAVNFLEAQTNYTFSIEVKANTLSQVIFWFAGTGWSSQNNFISANLANGTTNTTNSSLQDIGNGFYLFSATIATSASPIQNFVRVRIDTGSIGDNLFIKKPQLSKGQQPTTYQPRLQGGASDCFVTTWYDQIGSNHATQTVATNQPKIYDVLTGDITRENGKPAMVFDGIDDSLVIPNSTSLLTGLHKHNEFGELFGLFASDTVQNTNDAYIFSNSTGAGSIGYSTIYRGSGNSFIRSLVLRGVSGTNAIATNDFTPNDGLQRLYNASIGNTFSEKTNNVNGFTNVSYNNPRSSSDATYDFRIGANGISGDNFSGTIQELIIFNKNLTSEENNTLHNDINDHYGIF